MLNKTTNNPEKPSNTILNLSNFDPFLDDSLNNFNLKIDLRLQKRNAKKSITIIEGFIDYSNSNNLDSKKILKEFKKKNNCNGSIKENIIQLSGNQLENFSKFLIENFEITTENIIIHS